MLTVLELLYIAVGLLNSIDVQESMGVFSDIFNLFTYNRFGLQNTICTGRWYGSIKVGNLGFLDSDDYFKDYHLDLKNRALRNYSVGVDVLDVQTHKHHHTRPYKHLEIVYEREDMDHLVLYRNWSRKNFHNFYKNKLDKREVFISRTTRQVMLDLNGAMLKRKQDTVFIKNFMKSHFKF